MRGLSTMRAHLSLVLLSTHLVAPVTAASHVRTEEVWHRDDAQHLDIQVTTPASCSRPTRDGDRISVHYRGQLASTGVEFDQSYARGKPITFTLGAGNVIAGWDKGLLHMCPGEARRLVIPPDMAYGSSGVGAIPPNSILVFDTVLMDIVGVQQEETPLPSTVVEGGDVAIATAPAINGEDEAQGEKEEEQEGQYSGQGPATGPAGGPKDGHPPEGNCELLGPFALFVQAALGAVALLILVWKRWRETPRRPWKVWFFDVSKQVLGSMLLHVLNILVSELGASPEMHVVKAVQHEAKKHDSAPNPCSYYLLNLAIDTTIGIPVLWLLLRVLHTVARKTPLANPPESIKTGSYGEPPHTTWWLKQALIYFIGLVGMKLFVWMLFAMLPWLPWVGDWALRWTEGNEALQIAFVMFIFPVIMNAVQYYIIDSFIKDTDKGSQTRYEHVRDQSDEDERDNDLDDDEREGDAGGSDDSITVVEGDHGQTKGLYDGPSLRKQEPRPMGDGGDVDRGQRSPPCDAPKG